MNISASQRIILQHALGLHLAKKPYRNYYYQYLSDINLKDLVDKEYMTVQKHPSPFINSLNLFKVTQKGIDLVYTSPKKKEVIRVGDKVKIVNPKLIKRIGYPLDIETVIRNQMTKDDADKIDKLIIDVLQLQPKINGSIPFDYSSSILKTHNRGKREERLFDMIVREVAYIKLQKQGFGGNERTIHYDETINDLDSLKGLIFEVVDKKICKTGTRMEGWWDGEEGESPSFKETGTHVILTVEWHDPKFIYGDGKDPFAFMAHTITDEKHKKFKIEACNVEKVK